MKTLENLRRSVVSINTALHEAVNEMNPIILLRNVHPAYRADFASQLTKEEVITKEEAHEFVKFVR
jgi:hypothetical protein